MPLDQCVRKKSLVFPFVSMLHLAWAALLILDPAIIEQPHFYAMRELGFDGYDSAFLFTLASVLASLQLKTEVPAILTLIPQQIIALMCSFSALFMAWDAPTAAYFRAILAAQLPIFLVGIFHLCGMLRYGGWEWNISRFLHLVSRLSARRSRVTG